MTPSRLLLSSLLAVTMAACTASAQDERLSPSETAMTDTPSNSVCDMRFDTQESVARWNTVLDGVMGGRSSGNRFFEDDHMVFQGVINTNGGGFSSIRTPVAPGEMASADAMRLKVKSDGRAYKLTFRTDQRFRGRPVSFQAPIPATPEGEWAEVTVPLDGLATSVFGRDVDVDTFHQDKVEEIGIILADGVDGPFRIAIAQMGCT